MCNEIHLDVVALMWILGGSCLGILGVRGYRKYLSGKKNIVTEESNDSIDPISD
jgi:hypothetical protein